MSETEIPAYREVQPATEQAVRRAAGLDCHLCGFPIGRGAAVRQGDRNWHAKCWRTA